jgi:hypothetical protein
MPDSCVGLADCTVHGLVSTTEPDAGTVALLVMPLLLETWVRGKLFELMASTILLIIWATVADGEMCAMAWLPALVVILWIHLNGPVPLPPERDEYIAKRHRKDQGATLWQILPARWRTRLRKLPETYLWCKREDSRSSFRYHAYSPSTTRQKGISWSRQSARSMRLITVTCMAAASNSRVTAFDSDSKEIAIDNCSSRCLTNSRHDFLPGTVRKCNLAVIGVGGQVKCSIKGTVSWTIEDDLGRAHDIIIPDTPLCLSLPHRLLSPQHWAQETESRSRAPFLTKMRPSCSTTQTLLSCHGGEESSRKQ